MRLVSSLGLGSRLPRVPVSFGKEGQETRTWVVKHRSLLKLDVPLETPPVTVTGSRYLCLTPPVVSFVVRKLASPQTDTEGEKQLTTGVSF